MTHDTQIVLPFASLCGKQLQVDCNGGTVTSDGGVLLLREIEAQVGIIGRFVAALNDPRENARCLAAQLLLQLPIGILPEKLVLELGLQYPLGDCGIDPAKARHCVGRDHELVRRIEIDVIGPHIPPRQLIAASQVLNPCSVPNAALRLLR